MKIVSNSKKVIILILLKVILITIVSIILPSLVFSYLIYKLDLDLLICDYITYLITIISSFLIPFLCLSKIKNNGLLTGLSTVIPLLLIAIINAIINSTEIVHLSIKLAIIITISMLSGALRVKRNKKFKVK